MSIPFNPITSGFRTVRRNPVIVLTEVLWRWSFGMIAALVLFFSGIMLLGSVPATNSATNAWRSHDPAMMALVALHVIHVLGRKAVVAAMVLPASITLLWAVLAALGRSITVKLLRPGVAQLSFSSLLALHCLRAFVACVAGLGMGGGVWVSVWVPVQAAKPDLFLFYIMFLLSVLVICALWLTINCRLSLPAIFGIH